MRNIEYTYYYNTVTGDLLAKTSAQGRMTLDFPTFTSSQAYDLSKYRYNIQTSQVEPKN